MKIQDMPEGFEVIVGLCLNGHDFKIGEKVKRIRDCEYDGVGDCYSFINERGHIWYLTEDEIEPSNSMQAKIKKVHPEAKMPYRATEGATGYDVSCVSVTTEEKKIPVWQMGITPPDFHAESHYVKVYKHIYSTGLAIQPPSGYDIKLFPRSSVHKGWSWLSNSVGVGDQDFRGEYKFLYFSVSEKPPFAIGDRIGQLVFQKKEDIELIEAEELDDTVRGEGGFGSTGK